MAPFCHPSTQRLRWKHWNSEVDLGYITVSPKTKRWQHSSEAECLPSTWEAMGSIPNTPKTEKRRKEIKREREKKTGRERGEEEKKKNKRRERKEGWLWAAKETFQQWGEACLSADRAPGESARVSSRSTQKGDSRPASERNYWEESADSREKRKLGSVARLPLVESLRQTHVSPGVWGQTERQNKIPLHEKKRDA